MTAPIEASHGAALEAEARALADRHGLSDHPPRAMAALSQLRRVPDWLVHARSALGDSEGAVAKAAEWLLDNEYLVARGVRQIEQDLPKGFYARLPTLGGADAGRPRVWSIARALLRASRLQLSVPTVTRFLDAYQERTPLTIAELWALPTFLRLGCLEVLFAAFERLDRSLRPPFAIDDMPDIALEDTECVGRAISNLRTIASISWKDFFCRTSRVEAILREDPARMYQRMDFETRDAYRRAIEQLARRSLYSELEVAERAVACARQAVGGPLRHTDVGYWLVDEGVEEFERSIGCRPQLRRRASRWFFRHAAFLYLTALVAATAATIVLPAWYLTTRTTPLATVLTLVVVLLPASTLAVTCILWLVTVLVPPRILPKLDFDAAIPEECRTTVVMPTLVGNVHDARRQLERLELHYLANPDPAAQFVLLSDFRDASSEHEPSDQDILASLVAEVRRLNQKYPSKPFHVLHRPRRFNAAEGVWMAWERKRGKLEEFNRLLAGDPATDFTLHEGDRTRLEGVRYVVTLDVDTVLPKGALARLVGTLAHPLNRAEFDDVTSSAVRVESRRFFARIPRACTRGWTSRRETRTAVRSSNWPAAARIPSWKSLSGPSPALGRLSEALCGTRTLATGSWTRASRSSSGQSAAGRSFDDAREPMVLSPRRHPLRNSPRCSHRGDHCSSGLVPDGHSNPTIGDGTDPRRRPAPCVYTGRHLHPLARHGARASSYAAEARFRSRNPGRVQNRRRHAHARGKCPRRTAPARAPGVALSRQSGSGCAVRPLERFPRRVKRARAI